MKAVNYFEVEPFADGNNYNYANYKEDGLYKVRGFDGLYSVRGVAIYWIADNQITLLDIKEPKEQPNDISSIILKAIAVTQKPELILSVLPELFEAPIARKVVD